MNLWLIKAYVSEKCNLEKLARVYLEYIASKDEMLFSGELASALDDDFILLREYRMMKSTIKKTK